jgi:hypothetical protein
VVFVETSLFTNLLGDYLGDEEYRALQNHLIAHPGAGVIPTVEQIFFLTLYAKSEKDDLGSADLRAIVRLLTELGNG